MSEELLIRHCAPTLAGMKTGSLFSYRPQQNEDLNAELRRLNRLLGRKGLRVMPLGVQRGRVLIYVYRPDRLRRDLNDSEAGAMLCNLGYSVCSTGKCVAALMQRLRENGSFPHEIGLFLGYPPEDVAGFIAHRDCGCKCVGCWKVYGDAAAAEETFSRYKQCTSSYLRAFHSGRSLSQLAV